MAVRSRSSLHMRQDPDLNPLPPPSKRPRLDQHQHQHQQQQHFTNSLPSRHRRNGSSPDLLDTTIQSASPNASAVRSANSPLSTALPPRASSRLLSSASSYHHPRPSSPPSSNNPNTPRLKNRHDTPSATPAAALLRESPDPLDTISPAPAISSPRIRPSPAVRETRQHQQHKIENTPTENNRPAKTSRSNASRDSRRNSIPLPESQPADPSGGGSPIVRERRSLRSHDSGTRLRSELASYFPNYERLLSLEPQKTEFLTGGTTIQLVDDLTKPPSACLPLGSELPFGNPLTQFHNCEVIQLPEPTRDRDGEDPLNERTYFRPHRRVERQEKQIRNIERERAQHEKLQVDRLLDELRGQDWLRVMGITGVADNAKKLYEPKRDIFIRELTALIDKFKVWKEEEKRRKLAKDKPATTSPDAPEPDVDDIDMDVQSTEEPADLNDVDVQAARQLHREARSATGKKVKHAPPEKRRKSKTTPTAGQEQPQESQTQPPPILPPPPATTASLDTYPYIENKPFTSFFSDPHLRAAAVEPVSSSTGASRLAFGHAIPDMQERDFQLPDEILTEEAILASQRKQRRMKREGRRG